jgi:putative zinc finger protein
MSDVPTRLLRETLQSAMRPDASSQCIETETLAAWSDGTLSARERAAAESHASECARCQALLAAMVRTLPPAPARKWWQSSTFGWLVPIAVAATAVVVWVNVPPSRPEQSAVSTAASPPASVATAAPAGASAAPKTSADRADSRDAKRDALAAAPSSAAAPPAIAGRQGGVESRRARQLDTQSPVDADAARKEAREAMAAPPPPPPPAAPAAPRAEAQPQIAAIEAAPQSNAGAPAAAASALRPPARAMLDAAASARGQALAQAAPLEIVSPNPGVRWRIAIAGSIDRSTDGGATWQRQSTGVPVMPTAGVAPSSAICWLVGPGGVVLLSIDGRTWQRIRLPETVDLTSVRASDAVTATVTAADGRSFVTGDGGRTWRTP